MNELTPDLKSEIDRKSMEKAATLDQMLIEVCMIRNETSLISERLVRIESRINRVVELGKQMAAKVKEAGHISQLQAHAAGRREGLEAVEQQREEAGWVSRSYMDEALALKDKAIAQIQDTLAARCREMEREIETLTTCGCEGCDDNLEESAFCFPCMNKVQQQVTQLQATLAARCREMETELQKEHERSTAHFDLCVHKDTELAQLQATLAAREARIHDLERGLAAVLQVLQPFTEAQQASGGSGGAANQGAGA